MANRHLFVLPRGSYRGANQEEVHATVNGLVEMGLYKLPYDDDVYIQMSGYDCLSLKSRGIVDEPNVWVIVGPLGNKPSKTVKVSGYNSTNNYEVDLFTQPSVDPQQLFELIDSVASLLVALLATRNVVKSTAENKLAKLGIGGKKNLLKRFAYTTTISIPADLEDHESVVPGGSKCPHLRRGHIRRQHYGPNREFVKKIWIAPIFVNADPDFVNNRTAYNVSLGKEKACP